MQVRIEFSGDAYDPGDEYQGRCAVFVDGKEIAGGGNFADCPEDANLGRDLKFIYRLPDIIKQAYDAGKAGDQFVIEKVCNAD